MGIYIYVRTDENNASEFNRQLTASGFIGVAEDTAADKHCNVFAISLRQKVFTRLFDAPASRDVLSVEDFEDLFL